jgi:hypothetical protein
MGRECSAHGREGALFRRKKMMVEETVHEGASSLISDAILRSRTCVLYNLFEPSSSTNLTSIGIMHCFVSCRVL